MLHKEIKGSYDLIVSLGSSCEPAGHLRRLQLRTFSAPLDWMVSLSLRDVNRLLRNRFEGYMELGNMAPDEGSAMYVNDEVVQQAKSYFVREYKYNILSVHDFPIIPDQPWWSRYKEYKELLDYRIERFLSRMAESRNALFVRWGGSYEEAAELREVLGQLVGGEFRILMVQGIEGLESVIDDQWDLDRICSVSIPYRAGDLHTWDLLLEGVYLI